MDNEERDHFQALRQGHLRRLRVLEEQAAFSGKDTRAEIHIEIEDLKVQIAELDQQLGVAAAEPATSPSSRVFQVPRRNVNICHLSLVCRESYAPDDRRWGSTRCAPPAVYHHRIPLGPQSITIAPDMLPMPQIPHT